MDIDRPLLTGRAVAVLGGGAGLGREIALGLRDHGAAVTAAGPPMPRTREEAVDALAGAAGGPDGSLDGVVVVPAVFEGAGAVPLAGTDEEAWDAGAEAALRSALASAQAAFELLRRPGGRLVLLTASESLTGAAGFAPAMAASEGMRALCKSAARQWAAHGVTTACVATPAVTAAPGRPDGRTEVAPVVALLLSPAAAAVTGTTVIVDGGKLMVP